MTDGSWLYGESAIDIPRGDQREKIRRTFLVPHHNDSINAYPPVIKVIKEADYVITGPGDLYTSIIPNFLVSGVKKAVSETGAKLFYLVNIMTKFGETDNFTGEDFILELEKSIGRKIDIAILNSTKPNKKIIGKYRKQKAALVEISKHNLWDGRKIIKEDLLSISGGIIRHDATKLASLIQKLIGL